jgi:prevent-host-death family protein
MSSSVNLGHTSGPAVLNQGETSYSSEYHYREGSRMEKAISATDANRRFSEILRTVKRGRSVLVTSHGKPVARIMPVVEEEPTARDARATLFARLRAERVVKAGRWTRDELYDGPR